MMNKTAKTTTLLFVFFCCFSFVFTQVTQTTIQPSNKDATVLNIFPSVTENGSTISCYVDRNATTTYIRRAFIDFNLSSIPSNAIIIDAKLKLFRTGGLTNPHVRVSRVIEDWDETGSQDVNWSNQPDVSLSDEVVANPTVSSGFHIFTITDQVQEYVNYPNQSFGWRLASSSESPGSYSCLGRNGWTTCYYSHGSTYASRTYGTTSSRPILEVDWVLPIEIELQSITHATSTTNSNGSITADVSEGDGNYTYEWIDGSTGNVISGQTTSTVTGLSYGWYGLHVTDGEGVEAYKAFLVGANCETVTIDFDPGADYIDDAMVYDLVYNGTDYGQTYNGGSSTVVPRTERGTVSGNWYTCRSLVRFNLEIAQDLDIETSDLYLYGTGNHWNYNGGTNDSEINRITSDWEELLVTFDEAPGITSTDQILLPQTTSSAQNEIIDVIDFFQYWQTNPTNNFGLMFDLQDMTSNLYRRRRYYSSDASSSHPKVEFEVSIDCLSKVYVELQRKLDGGHYNAVDDEVSFIHREEYSDTDGLLDFRILDYQGSEVLNSSNQSVAIKPGYNEVDIDVSSLSAGMYVLEVKNEKEETLKLRFKI